MNVNCVNIEREEESLNITNINLLVRFNKTREIFPSVTQVLSIFLTTAATSANVERASSKEHVPKVPCPILAASYAQRWALCSNNSDNVEVSVKRVEVVYKEIASPFTCCPVNCEYSWNKIQIEKKQQQKVNYAWKHVRADPQCSVCG